MTYHGEFFLMPIPGGGGFRSRNTLCIFQRISIEELLKHVRKYEGRWSRHWLMANDSTCLFLRQSNVFLLLIHGFRAMKMSINYMGWCAMESSRAPSLVQVNHHVQTHFLASCSFTFSISVNCSPVSPFAKQPLNSRWSVFSSVNIHYLPSMSCPKQLCCRRDATCSYPDH